MAEGLVLKGGGGGGCLAMCSGKGNKHIQGEYYVPVLQTEAVVRLLMSFN